MSRPDVLAWLAGFQRDFGSMLRTPLDRSTGTLMAMPSRYGTTILATSRPGLNTSVEDRLAVYNRQYWFRLFGVLQGEHPLTTAVVGAWTFNELAAQFLLEHPPGGKDLGDVAVGFAAFLDASLPREPLRLVPGAQVVPRAALVQAASIDAAFREVFLAPPQPVLRLSPAEAANLSEARLVPSAASRTIEEEWPLVELRRQLGARRDEAPCTLPEPHPQGVQRWIVCRGRGGERIIPLVPAQARLFELLCVHPVGRALALLEAEHAGADATALARNVQRWLAEGMALGLWRGLVGGAA